MSLESECINKSNASACSEAGFAYLEGRIVKADSKKALSFFDKGCYLGNDFDCAAVALGIDIDEHKDEQKSDTAVLAKDEGKQQQVLKPLDDKEIKGRVVRACIRYLKSNGKDWSKPYRVTGMLFSGSELNEIRKSDHYSAQHIYYYVKFKNENEVVISLKANRKYLPKEFETGTDLKLNLWQIRYGFRGCSIKD